MSPRTFSTGAAAATLLGLAIGFAAGGIRGLSGIALGLFVAAFGLWVWWRAIGMLAAVAADNPPPRLGTFLVVLAFLIKLPLYILAVLAVVKIGGPARPCFLAGLSLVYFGLIGRAVAVRAEPS